MDKDRKRGVRRHYTAKYAYRRRDKPWRLSRKGRNTPCCFDEKGYWGCHWCMKGLQAYKERNFPVE